MADIALEGLKQACVHQVAWLHGIAEKYEAGASRHSDVEDGIDLDTTAKMAEEFRHQANNLQAVLNAYERLLSKVA